MTRTIQLVAMRTWGELGNLLAAKTLASALSQTLDGVETEVIEAETLFPRFAEIGREIELLAKTRCEARVRHRQYLELMEGLRPLFYPGFEVAPRIEGALGEEIRPLVEHFMRTRPSLVVGTKGVISRLCMAALRLASHPAPVVNYVTNEGLLRLEIHRSPFLPDQFVPFESARRYLIDQHGFEPACITTVGRLIAQASLGSFLEQRGEEAYPTESPRDAPAPGLDSVRVAVFSNRGGEDYLLLLRHFAARHPQIAVVFIGYNEPQLVEAARQLGEESSVRDWRVFDRLGQGGYIQYLNWLSAAEYPLLISKTGPNTMLEGAYFGIPQLLLNSGLPMEQWVIPFLEENGIGRGFDRMPDLIRVLDEWLAGPHVIAERSRRARDLSRTVMDQQQTRERIGSEFARLMQWQPNSTP
jgi:UDP-N-acetylglucosamine:LPS N-acetylglucosamine transferase